MFYWSESFTSLIRFWQPQFDGLTRLTLTPLDFTTDLRHCIESSNKFHTCHYVEAFAEVH